MAMIVYECACVSYYALSQPYLLDYDYVSRVVFCVFMGLRTIGLAGCEILQSKQ